MKNLLYNILIASVILSLSCAPIVTYAMPEPAPATQTDKQKAAAQKKKEAEKRKKEQEKAKAAREKQKAADAKKREAEKKKLQQQKKLKQKSPVQTRPALSRLSRRMTSSSRAECRWLEAVL